MKVVEFPGCSNLNKKASRVKKEELPNKPQNNLVLGEAGYTCPNCKNRTNIKFEGMIFRTLDFHCSNCGSRHKISNPAFSKNS